MNHFNKDYDLDLLSFHLINVLHCLHANLQAGKVKIILRMHEPLGITLKTDKQTCTGGRHEGQSLRLTDRQTDNQGSLPGITMTYFTLFGLEQLSSRSECLEGSAYKPPTRDASLNAHLKTALQYVKRPAGGEGAG